MSLTLIREIAFNNRSLLPLGGIQGYFFRAGKYRQQAKSYPKPWKESSFIHNRQNLKL